MNLIDEIGWNLTRLPQGHTYATHQGPFSSDNTNLCHCVRPTIALAEHLQSYCKKFNTSKEIMFKKKQPTQCLSETPQGNKLDDNLISNFNKGWKI